MSRDYYAGRRAAAEAMYPRITGNTVTNYILSAREGYTVRQSHGGGWVLEVGDDISVEYHDTLGAALASIQRMNRAQA